MRTIVHTALAAATAALIAACSEPAPTPSPFVETITLHSTGADPLEQLRLTPEPGATLTVASTLTFEHEVFDDRPPTILTTSYHTPAGSSEDTLIVESLAIDTESGIDIVEGALDGSATVVTIARTLTGATDKQNNDTSAPRTVASDPYNLLALPEEPVGIGAEWTVSRESNGPRLTTNSTVRFTLVSLTPDTITLDIDMRIESTASSENSDWPDAKGTRTGRLVYDRRFGVPISGTTTGPYTQFGTTMNMTTTYTAAD